MNSNRSDSQSNPSAYQWYTHPLTSLVTVAVLAVVLIIPFGTATAAFILTGMLTFLTACKDAYQPGDRREETPDS